MSQIAPRNEIASTDSGPVTLIDLAALKSRIDGRRSELKAAQDQATSLRALADDRYAELGQLLVTNPSRWNPPANFSGILDKARSLQARVDADVQAIAAIDQK